MKFGHIMVFVSDKEQARQFYSDVLELQLVDEDGKRLIYDIGGQHLVLFETLRSVEPLAYSEEARTVLVFTVEDVEESYRNLKERGVTFLHSRPTPQRYAAFVDPFGNVHEILEDDKA
ncbi:glyoxalase [Chryseomicrobium excrementi]|uniref:Glyoxalase n=1 Tax=Chryseomicrobium excrementi TaxID=2041346 RepID=A0A2M9EZF4_9BACL|nr:VOC family protein [Chryseomicrobium excrementi]PJK16586.1 glyoxalase [Chryseomicrobium excrementi]